MTTLYAILGIDKDATQQEVKQAYKKAALKTHPDRAAPERKPEAEAAFKQIAEAYEVLGDANARRRYDRDIFVPSPSSSPSDNFYFGTSPDAKPFSFQWESGHDSARRFANSRRFGPQQSHQQQQRHPFGYSTGGERFGAGMASSTDPFALFNHMFQNEFASAGPLGQGMGMSMADDPFFANHRRMTDTNVFGFGGSGGGAPPSSSSSGSREVGAGPMGMAMTDPFFGGGGGIEDAFASDFASPMGGQSTSTMQSFTSSSGSRSSGGGRGGAGGGMMAASESRSTRTINGKTESHYRRVDPDGTETVHVKSSDGEQVFVDGVRQKSHPLLDASTSQNSGSKPLPIGIPR